MARQPEIQYIRFYTDGSAARQLDPILPRKKKKTAQLPKKKPQKKLVVWIDPLALCALVVAAVMVVLMVVGSVQLLNARQQRSQMATYVRYLQYENFQLTQTFESGYDIKVVEEQALALGMIPAEQAQQITISVPMPQVEEEAGLWDRVSTFFSGIFA